MHLLLQILEEEDHRLARARSTSATPSSSTSNIGAERSRNPAWASARPAGQHYDVMKDKILEEAKKVLKPEFVNRLDDLIVFHSLGKTELLEIVDLEISKVTARIKIKEITIVLDEKAK